MWQPISTAPFDRDLALAVIDEGELSPSWPSRDQWAQHRRDTHYKRGFEPFQVSDSLSDYANAAEIEMTISMLKSLWAACGREMRAAQKTVGPLARQPGESGADYHRRWRAMSEADQERAIRTDHLRHRRHCIRRALAVLRKGFLPSRNDCELAKATVLDELIARRDAAYEAARAAWVKKKETTPIDDVAWQAELERRRQLEADLARSQAARIVEMD
jgi:hypothetical protein